jgi:hypothetical protein
LAGRVEVLVSAIDLARDAAELTLPCGACKCDRQFSPRVVSVTVWMPHLIAGWHILEPTEELRICLSCQRSKFVLVDRCVRLHPATANAPLPWTKAAILFADAVGMTVRQPGTEKAMALA